MGLRIRTNISSLTAQRSLQNSTNAMRETSAQLASGYRINKAADDAAGLAISSSMTARTKSLEQATRNANDGISLIQVAEGGMNEITNILVRLRELATQAASDTIGNKERSYTNREYVGLVDEIERIANTTEFNGLKLFKGAEGAGGAEGLFSIHVGACDASKENTDVIKIDVNNMKFDPLTDLGLGKASEIGPLVEGGEFSRATAAAKLSVLDSALSKISSNRSYLGAQQSRMGSAINNLGIEVENLKSANSRIRDVDFASASAQFTQNRILQSAGISVLSQANSEPNAALELLR